MSEPDRPSRGFARLAAGVVALAAAAAAPELPVDGYRDLQLTVHARRALRQEPVLGSLNLGVRVRGGVATLWGPVPSADLVGQAVKRLESVQGVLEVRSELYVATPETDLRPLLVVPPEEPQRTESASPDPQSGSLGALTGRSGDANSAPGPAQPPRGAEPAVPVSVPGAEAPPSTPPLHVASPPPSAPLGPESLPLTVERLRRGEPRFRALHAEVRGAVVVITGGGERGDDIMALARAVSRLPGVDRVVTKTDDGPAP
jgi:hypothetical protein